MLIARKIKKEPEENCLLTRIFGRRKSIARSKKEIMNRAYVTAPLDINVKLFNLEVGKRLTKIY